MLNMGGSYLQRQQMKAFQSAQRSASTEAQHMRKRQRLELEGLEEEIAHLRLITESLWELVSEVTGLTTEQLVQRINEVDMDDGKLDGRKVHPPVDCTGCHAKIAPGVSTCSYCGEPAPPRSPFAI